MIYLGGTPSRRQHARSNRTLSGIGDLPRAQRFVVPGARWSRSASWRCDNFRALRAARNACGVMAYKVAASMHIAPYAHGVHIPTMPPETARDHVANAVQLLLGAEAALERLGLLDNESGDVTDLRESLRGAMARCFKALFLLDNPSGKGAR